MAMQKSNKVRLLWIIEKELDITPSTSRVIEIITHLQEHYTIQLLADYCNKKLQPDVLDNEIVYYHAAKTPYVKRVTRYVSQLLVFRSVSKSFQPHIAIFETCNLVLLKYAVTRRRKHNLRLIFDVRTLPVEIDVFRNWINSRLQVLSLRYAARHFDGITYITNQMKDHCIEKYGLHPHASTVWTSGVNAELFSSSTGNSPSHPFTIMYHGIIERQRQIDNVIKAISLLRDVDIRFVLLGTGSGLEDLRRLVESLGLKDRVSFMKPVEYNEVPKWINRCDAGILPFQNWEGWNVSSPIKLFEYLACGKPVIVTDIPAHRNVLGNADCAFWAKESSPQDIAAAIGQAYDKRNDSEHVRLNARKLVLDGYTWSKQAQKISKFLEDVRKS